MSSKNVRRESDFYPTPAEAIEPLMHEMIANGEAQKWHRILDLGCGDGRLARSAKAACQFASPVPVNPYLVGVEENVERARAASDLGVDFVKVMSLDDAAEDYDLFEVQPNLIIANPPYTQAQEFLEAAMDIFYAQATCHMVAFLLRLNFLGSQKRHSMWATTGAPKLRVLSKRPSFTRGGTDSTEYAWFIWGGGEAVRPLDWYAPQG